MVLTVECNFSCFTIKFTPLYHYANGCPIDRQTLKRIIGMDPKNRDSKTTPDQHDVCYVTLLFCHGRAAKLVFWRFPFANSVVRCRFLTGPHHSHFHRNPFMCPACRLRRRRPADRLPYFAIMMLMMKFFVSFSPVVCSMCCRGNECFSLCDSAKIVNYGTGATWLPHRARCRGSVKSRNFWSPWRRRESAPILTVSTLGRFRRHKSFVQCFFVIATFLRHDFNALCTFISYL